MPIAPRITVQDPSLSPTFSLSTNQTNQTVPSSLRRNLFSAHLSRRPVSTSTPSIFAPSSPNQQNGQPRHDVFSSGPTLHPTKRTMDLKNIYDADASPPNHTLPTSTTSNLFPRESIIAVNPSTGRPLLPNIPTLPPRLRLSEEDEGEEGSEDEMEHREYLDYGRPYSRSPSHNRNFMPSSDFDFDPDVDLDSSDLNFIGIPRGQAAINSFMDTADNDESRRGRERIERLLAEMMNKQRARARTLAASDSSGSLYTSSSTPAHNASSEIRAARGGKARERKMEETQARYGLQRSTTEPKLGGVGATMDPFEKDELMGLIMTSLRRKLQQAEDEGWMYGGAEGLGGIGVSAELGGDGVYD